MMLFMGFFWLLILGGISALVIWAFRELMPQKRHPEDEALSILAQRYARGEIDAAEFDSKRQQLLRYR